MENEATNHAKTLTHTKSPRRWRRAVVATWLLLALVASGVILLPTAALQTRLRDQPLNKQLAKAGLTASSGSASGGWFDPITLNDVQIQDPDGYVQLTIKQIKLTKSALTLLANPEHLGRITIIQPDLKLTLDEDGNLPLKFQLDDQLAEADQPKTECQIDIQNAAFMLDDPTRPLPIVQASGFDVSAAFDQRPEGYFLDIDPVVLMDHRILTDADTSQNLALIAPILAQTTTVQGAVSVDLEASSIHLDAEGGPNIFPIRGTAIVHDLDAILRDKNAIEMLQIISQRTQRNIPTSIKMAKDSAIAFEIDELGAHHKGLSFLIPELAGGATVTSSGTVGFDKNIDLSFGVSLPNMQQANPLAGMVSNLVIPVTGTVDNPEFPKVTSLLDQVVSNVGLGKEVGMFKSIVNFIAARRQQQENDPVAAAAAAERAAKLQKRRDEAKKRRAELKARRRKKRT